MEMMEKLKELEADAVTLSLLEVMNQGIENFGMEIAFKGLDRFLEAINSSIEKAKE